MVDAFTVVFWIIPRLRCQKTLSITISEEAALSSLSRLYILANLLGNERPWFVICDWWISIRFVYFCVSRLDVLFLKSTVSFTLALRFFKLLYTETWQV